MREHRYLELIDVLSAAIEHQTDQKYRQQLSESLELLKNGFTSTEASKHHFTMKVALLRGVAVVKVPKDVVHSIGAAEVARCIVGRREWQGKRSAGKQWDPTPPINREPLRRIQRPVD